MGRRRRTPAIALLAAGLLGAAPGDLWLGQADSEVWHLDAATGVATPVAAGGLLSTVYGLAVEPGGGVLALGFGGACAPACAPHLFRVDPDDGGVSIVATLAPEAPFALPFSLAIEPGGRTAVFLPNRHVHRVDLETGAVSIVGSLPPGAGISWAVAAAPDGTLWASDAASGTLHRVDPVSGDAVLVASGTGFGGFYRAHGIAVDREGRIVAPRYDPPAVLRLDPAGGAPEVVTSGGLLRTPVEIEVDRDGTLLVSNLWEGEVVRVDPETGAQSLVDVPWIVTGLALEPWPACRNGFDDDGDGAADFPADPGCYAAASLREDPQCQNGVDDDAPEDGRIDFDGGASAGLPPALRTEPDPECIVLGYPEPWRDREAAAPPPSCGLGAELLVLAGWLARRAFSGASARTTTSRCAARSSAWRSRCPRP